MSTIPYIKRKCTYFVYHFYFNLNLCVDRNEACTCITYALCLVYKIFPRIIKRDHLDQQDSVWFLGKTGINTQKQYLIQTLQNININRATHIIHNLIFVSYIISFYLSLAQHILDFVKFNLHGQIAFCSLINLYSRENMPLATNFFCTWRNSTREVPQNKCHLLTLYNIVNIYLTIFTCFYQTFIFSTYFVELLRSNPAKYKKIW